jgi:hypothetical protein
LAEPPLAPQQKRRVARCGLILTLRLTYRYGDLRGTTEVVRVEEYTPPPVTFVERLKRRLTDDLRARIS